MASLPNLPIEITTFILDSLKNRDLLSLRRTCKEMNARTAHLVINRYFKKRFVMFERRSLECLEAIARSPTLGQSVQELEICTVHLIPASEIGEIEPVYSGFDRRLPHLRATTPYRQWSVDWGSDDEEAMETNDEQAEKPDDEEEEETDDEEAEETDDEDAREVSPATNRLRQVNLPEYRREYHDQEEMMRTGDDIKCLTRAMKLLKGCRKVGFSSRVRAWGLHSLKRRIGIIPQRALTFESTRSKQRVTHIIHGGLIAAAVSQIPIETLSFGDEEVLENANCLVPQMLTGSSSPILCQYPLVSLRRLYLSLDSEITQQFEYSSSGGSGLNSFVQHLPELSDLEISFRQYDEFDEYRLFVSLSYNVYIPKLHSLTLVDVDCSSWEVAFLLLRHNRTLREVTLFSLDLDDGAKGWIWLMEVIRDSLELDCLSVKLCYITYDATDTALQDVKITSKEGFTGVIDRLTSLR